MFRNYKEKGFTLIELLVVIAIIGILSTIVLSSLGTARDRAKQASAKGTMSQVRNQAELYFDGSDSGNYDGMCVSGTEVDDLIQAAALEVADASPYCDENGNSYSAGVQLDSDTWFCVDSNGVAKEVSGTAPSSGTSCP